MPRKKKEANRVDQLLDELLEDCQSPEDILGENGLMNQLKKRLVERALAGDRTGHNSIAIQDGSAGLLPLRPKDEGKMGDHALYAGHGHRSKPQPNDSPRLDQSR